MKSEHVASPRILFFFFILFLLVLTEIVCSISVIPAEIHIKEGKSSEILVHNNAKSKAEYSTNYPACLSATPKKFKLNPGKTKRVKITSHCNNTATIAILEEINGQTFKSTILLKIETSKTKFPTTFDKEDAKKEKTAILGPHLSLLIIAAATSVVSAILLRNSATKNKEKS